MMSPRVEDRDLSPRANNFDFLRLVLALMVICSHSYIVVGRSNQEPLSRLTGGQIGTGDLAVTCFFILSGFLITKSWLHAAGLWDYLRHRVLRIYPGYLAAVAFCVLVAYPWMRNTTRQHSSLAFVLQTLNLDPPLSGVFTWHPNSHINPSLWTIRYEFLCYLGVAVLGLVGALRRRYLVLTAFLVSFAVYALQILFHARMPGIRMAWIYGDPVYWPRLATSFLAGSLFYLYRDRIAYTRWPVVASAAVLAVFSALPVLKGLQLAAPLLGGYILLYVGFLPIRRLRSFASQRDLSYGTYLYGFPIQQLVFDYFGPNLQPTAISVIAVAIAAGLAFLSWTFVEAPFLRKKTRASASVPCSESDGNGVSRGLLCITTRPEELPCGSPASAMPPPSTEHQHVELTHFSGALECGAVGFSD